MAAANPKAASNAQSEALLIRCIGQINHPCTREDERAVLLREAYHIGRLDGRCEGAELMGKNLLGTFDKVQS